MVPENVHLIRQITPVLIGSLLTVSFGTMVGWPSIAFPLLVDPESSPILITWDDSAVLAGTLMVGYIVGTAFSTITIYGSKTGILLSLCCQIAGWMVLFCAKDAIEIGISRALVGLGNGFGSQQLRTYAQGSCSSSLFQSLMQYMPLSLNVGVIFVYSVGGFVTFRVLSLIGATIPILALVLFAAIPKNLDSSYNEKPLEQIGTIFQGEKSLENSRDDSDEKEAMKNIETQQLGFIGAFKEKEIRQSFFWLTFLISVPQYTGGTANIVYSQVMYAAAFNRYPKLCSVVYAVVFLISNIAALTYTKKYYRRPVLLGSCIICSGLLCLVCCYFYFLFDLLEMSMLFTWSPLCLLSLYNFFHTMGLNIIPILFINDKFPNNAKTVASKFYIMYSSLSGLISTKIFQILFTYHGIHTAYLYLSVVGIVSAFIIFLFVKESSRCQKQEIDSFHNEVDLTDETSTNRNNVNTSENSPERCNILVLQNDVPLNDETRIRGS